MKILVTGHRGFIGSEVYSLLSEKGYDVTGFDLGDEFKDQEYDYIAHFAARTLIRLSKEKPYEYFSDDLDLTLRVMELARSHKSKFIFPTSGSIAKPTNPYSLSKKQAVEWIELYRDLYSLDSYVLKLFNIYGEKSRKGAVYLFCHAAATGDVATIYGSGDHKRDYTHVSDVSKFVLRIIEGEIKPGSYELGTGVGTSVNDLLTMVENISGKQINKKHQDYILDEAEELFAKEPALKDFVKITDGVSRVYRTVSKIN